MGLSFLPTSETQLVPVLKTYPFALLDTASSTNTSKTWVRTVQNSANVDIIKKDLFASCSTPNAAISTTE
jgi:hypothetical protein